MSKGFPSMTALLGLLAVAGFQNRDRIAEMLGGQNRGAPGGQLGGQIGSSGGYGSGPMGTGAGRSGGLDGVLSGLGGLLGGAGAAGGVGGLLSGGLGQLVDKFRGAGHGDTVDSWVGHGPNREMAPRDLEAALGDDTLDELTQQTGLSRQEIVERLSRELPTAVDRYTPAGRLPSAQDIG